jgi:hypothetical protein
MDVQTAFKANAQLAEACEPRVRALHDPAVLVHTLAALGTWSGDAIGDAPLPQMGAALPVVVAIVGVQRGGSLASLSRKSFDGRHGSTHRSDNLEW